MNIYLVGSASHIWCKRMSYAVHIFLMRYFNKILSAVRPTCLVYDW